MGDGEALLAAILAHPDDDTPRLVYADWLQEQGQDARAEFIRVQCELGVWCDLHPREAELRDANPHWSRVECPKCLGTGNETSDWGGCLTCHGTGDLLQTRDAHRVAFRRGFIDSVSCTLADVMREVRRDCPCGNDVPHSGYGFCMSCGEQPVRVWCPTPWAAALVQALPLLTRLRLTDRKPTTYDAGSRLFGFWCWYVGDGSTIPHSLPAPLWDEIDRDFATAADADDALAVAAVKWLRTNAPQVRSGVDTVHT